MNAGDPDPVRFAIRPAVLDDLERVASLHWRSWMATYGPLLAPAERALLTLDERRAAWRPQLQGDPPLTTVFVAERRPTAEELAGLVSSVAATGASAEGSIPALHVDPALHGMGIGRRLLDMALDDLRTAGCGTATLAVLASNPRARGFYEHLGWTLDGPPFRERMEELDALPVVELDRYRLEL